MYIFMITAFYLRIVVEQMIKFLKTSPILKNVAQVFCSSFLFNTAQLTSDKYTGSAPFLANNRADCWVNFRVLYQSLFVVKIRIGFYIF